MEVNLTLGMAENLYLACPKIREPFLRLPYWNVLMYTVPGQNLSSNALFTPKMDIFNKTILNTAYIKTLEIFLSARESLSIQTSMGRNVRNQSSFHGS